MMMMTMSVVNDDMTIMMMGVNNDDYDGDDNERGQ